MSSRIRAYVLAVSIPVIVFAVIGGYLGQVMAQGDQTFRYLRVFEDVVSLVVSNYVEPVDIRKAMGGAMKGLTDGLDPESAWLSPELVKAVESNVAAGPADVGLDVTRQYYLRVVSARDGSPAARAGLRPGDFVRAIDNKPTRDISTIEGARLLQGAAGSKVSLLVIRGNAADPHPIDLVRERPVAVDITSRMADAGTGYIRIPEFTSNTPSRLKQAIDAVTKTGAQRLIVDLRGTARGDLDEGVNAARLFVRDKTLAIRTTRTNQREVIAGQPGDGAVTLKTALLVDPGTSSAAEVFAAALADADRAELVGTNTLGRAARQRLVKLPDQSGLWLTYVRYLTPANDPIHENGLEPDVAVEYPDIEIGAAPPTPDPWLQKALERLSK
jgi:carboxyl-terminal processing protease